MPIYSVTNWIVETYIWGTCVHLYIVLMLLRNIVEYKQFQISRFILLCMPFFWQKCLVAETTKEFITNNPKTIILLVQDSDYTDFAAWISDISETYYKPWGSFSIRSNISFCIFTFVTNVTFKPCYQLYFWTVQHVLFLQCISCLINIGLTNPKTLNIQHLIIKY